MYCKSMNYLMPHGYSTPGPDKKNPMGEDAHKYDQDIIVVCDGVGGWSSQGVDPSVFSNSLCTRTYDYLRQAKDSGSSQEKESLILNAIKSGLAQSLKYTGSATITVGMIDNDMDKLFTANIGDSGYMIVREGKLFYKSTEMQYVFNFPVQIGTHAEKIDYVDSNEHELEKGDILIFGTDGIWDNLFEMDVIKVLEEHVSNHKVNLADIKDLSDTNVLNQMTKEFSEGLVLKSLFHSKNNSRDGPFAVKGKLACSDENYQNFNKQNYGRTVHERMYYGGKEDDITVVVRIV